MVFGDGSEEILGGMDRVPLEALVLDGVADVSAMNPRGEPNVMTLLLMMSTDCSTREFRMS